MTDENADAKANATTPKSGGKRLSDIKEVRDYATGKASDVARNSAFAGIAVIWILTNQGGTPISGLLLAAMALLVAGLLADFLQYAYNSTVWRDFYNQEYEKHNSDDALIDIPPELSAKTYRLFNAKIILFVVGFLFLITGAVACLKIAS